MPGFIIAALLLGLTYKYFYFSVALSFHIESLLFSFCGKVNLFLCYFLDSKYIFQINDRKRVIGGSPI